jgi:hypothetical protein
MVEQGSGKYFYLRRMKSEAMNSASDLVIYIGHPVTRVKSRLGWAGHVARVGNKESMQDFGRGSILLDK